MDFNEEKCNTTAPSKKLLYSIVAGYPNGIGDLELLKKYSKIQSESKELVPVSNVAASLYDMKGTLVDFRTVSGIRVFSVLRKRAPLSLVHPSIRVGMDGPLRLVRPVSVADCNSFCVYLVEEEEHCINYTQKIHDACEFKQLRLFKVQKWDVHVGDCFVAFSQKYRYYLRVKVIKHLETTNVVMCFLVDLGRYESFNIDDLKIVPEIGAYFHHTLKTFKQFKHHAYAIRCFINVAEKPYGGFPNSRTGLRLALCGSDEFRNIKLQLRFVAYDHGSDSFMVDVFNEDGKTPTLEDAVNHDSAILEKDNFYAMRADWDSNMNAFETEDDGRERFNDFVHHCERIFEKKKTR